MSEPLTRMLAELPSAAPDPARAERIRMKCRSRLARQAARPAAPLAVGRPGPVASLWQPLLGVVGLAYLAEVIVQALGVSSPP